MTDHVRKMTDLVHTVTVGRQSPTQCFCHGAHHKVVERAGAMVAPHRLPHTHDLVNVRAKKSLSPTSYTTARSELGQVLVMNKSRTTVDVGQLSSTSSRENSRLKSSSSHRNANSSCNESRSASAACAAGAEWASRLQHCCKAVVSPSPSSSKRPGVRASSNCRHQNASACPA